MFSQRTLGESVAAVGIGLHSGRKIRLVLRPAPADTGIVFRRVDLEPPVDIPAEPLKVNDTRMATTVNVGRAAVATIEHLMSAFSGLGVDNCIVEVNAPEIPVMDGSGASFVYLLHSAGIVEAALAMGASAYPISAIYLHLVAVMDYMSMKQTDRAQAHLLTAWEVARPDDLIEGFGEHHGLLGAMLEAAIKPKWPEDFKRIIDITYRFSSGWRRVHNPVTGHDVADDLTTTEFAIAMLAARNWTTQEIAEHLDISANTVKKHIFEAMRKLGIKNRKDLKKYMLQ